MFKGLIGHTEKLINVETYNVSLTLLSELVAPLRCMQLVKNMNHMVLTDKPASLTNLSLKHIIHHMKIIK